MKKQDFKVLRQRLVPVPDNPFHVAEDETLSGVSGNIKNLALSRR